MQKPSSEARLRTSIFVIGFGVLAIFFLNNVLGSINFSANEWTFPHLLPTQQPPGSDFYWGIYVPAELLRSGRSPYALFNCYPPLVSVFGLPYTFLSMRVAYTIHLVLLFAANVAVLRLSVDLAARAFRPVGAPASRVGITTPLLMLMTFAQFTSYGFLFSLERGNSDIFAMLLSVVVLWLVIRRPRTLFTQVVLLSIAVHLKVYPGILFILLFRRHRWRCLLPALLCNVGLSLILGWKPIPEVLAGIKSASTFEGYMVLNHSVNSFVATVLNPTWDISRRGGLLLVALPAMVWTVGVLVLWRRPFSAKNALLMFALSVPVMHLVTNISFDYKLVITAAPIAMLLCACVVRFAADGSKAAALTGCTLLVLMGVISRSYTVTPFPWVANKCPAILLLELLVLAAIVVPGVTSPVLGTRRNSPARPREASLQSSSVLS